MSVFTAGAEAQAAAVGHLLAETVREYFRDEGHREEFQKWREERRKLNVEVAHELQ